MNFKVVVLLGARTARYLLKLLSRYYFAKPPRAHSTVASNGKLIKKNVSYVFTVFLFSEENSYYILI